MAEYTANAAILKVLLNNKELSADMLANLISIHVENEVNVPTMFTIRFSLRDMENGQWFGVDLETFKLGDTVTISMGTDQSEELVVGEISDIEPSFGDDNNLTIRGFDRMHRLRFGKFKRSFEEMSDADIVSQIAVDAGLTASVESTQSTYPYVYQNNISNYEFILSRIIRIGFEISVKDKELILRPSQENQTPGVTLEYGITLLHFAARMKALTMGSTVEVRGWNMHDKVEITGSAADGDENSIMGGQASGHQLTAEMFNETVTAIIDEHVIDDANADLVAKGTYNNMIRDFITGDGEIVGNPAITAGITVELKGLGKRFSGSYYIIKSSHYYDTDTGYTTKFNAQRSGA